MNTRTPTASLVRGGTAATTHFHSHCTTKPNISQRDIFLDLVRDSDRGWVFDQFLRRGPRVGLYDPAAIVAAVIDRLIELVSEEPAKQERYNRVLSVIGEHHATALQCAQYAIAYEETGGRQ